MDIFGVLYAKLTQLSILQFNLISTNQKMPPKIILEGIS
jgi:hypothetical protein